MFILQTVKLHINYIADRYEYRDADGYEYRDADTDGDVQCKRREIVHP